MKKTFFLIAGVVVTFVGAIIFVSPAPFGFAILIPGLALLVMGSDTVAEWIRDRRRKHDELDEKMLEAESEAPEEVSEPLQKTDPNEIK